MAGSVDERDREPPHGEVRGALHLDEVGPEAAEELALGAVDVDLGPDSFEQLLDAGDAARHAPVGQAPAHVILVGVRDQRAGDADAVGLGRAHDGVDLPGGVHDDALARLAVPHEVDEVLHGTELHLPEVELPGRPAPRPRRRHRPSKRGARRSRAAASPSWRSALPKVIAWQKASYSTAAATALSSPW